MTKSPTAPGKTSVASVRDALKYREAGLTWPQISEKMGIPISTIHGAAQREVDRIRAEIRETATDLIGLQNSRLDRIVAQMFLRMQTEGASETGIIAAANTVIRAEDRRAKLHGLDAPAKREIRIVAQEVRAQAESDMMELIGELDLSPDQQVRAAAWFERRAEQTRALAKEAVADLDDEAGE